MKSYSKVLSCEGKKAYPTPQMANKALRSLSRGSKGDSVRARNHKVRVVAYKCNFCHQYHLGKDVVSSRKIDDTMIE